MNWLQGKKTYIICIIIGVLAGVQAGGYQIPEWVYMALSAMGLYTARSGAKADADAGGSKDGSGSAVPGLILVVALLGLGAATACVPGCTTFSTNPNLENDPVVVLTKQVQTEILAVGLIESPIDVAIATGKIKGPMADAVLAAEDKVAAMLQKAADAAKLGKATDVTEFLNDVMALKRDLVKAIAAANASVAATAPATQASR